MQCHSRDPRTRSGSQNEVIGTKFRHLVVNTSQTLYECSITKQPHSHITGQNRLKNPGHLPGTMPLFKWIHSQCKKSIHVIGTGPTTCQVIRTDSSHKRFRVVKIPIRQSSHAYANFTIKPIPDLYSCMSKHVTSQARIFYKYKYLQKNLCTTKFFFTTIKVCFKKRTPIWNSAPMHFLRNM
ncbi:hypothetical protein M9H77_20321 [Catharanthus roseus]|uniref:Uncharacterized protein n=1 Tax=Catharanthus roseus TaxID=4058 RepID=A0ACC0ANJ6_CATRO|nr:hypothetical protein M9H77_20321 [Catharanthus roseus]